MQTKRPVYNGYMEAYVSGKELKDMFCDEYVSNGRHHAVVLGIKIPNYLDLLDIDDEIKYRIFHNDAFCLVLDSETDKEITFFAHNKKEKITLYSTQSFNNPTLNTICPECGSKMGIRHSKYGIFSGCSAYPKCKYKENIVIIGSIKENLEQFMVRD